jgi:hypothetical protein
MKRARLNKALNFGDNFEPKVHLLQFEIIVRHFLMFGVDVQNFRTLCWHWLATLSNLNECQRGEAIGLLFENEDHNLSLNDFMFHSQPCVVLDVEFWQQEVYTTNCGRQKVTTHCIKKPQTNKKPFTSSQESFLNGCRKCYSLLRTKQCMDKSKNGMK